MGEAFTVGEGVIWLSPFGIEHRFVRVDAENVRVAHGRALIRVLERLPKQPREQLVERWVEPESLRKR